MAINKTITILAFILFTTVPFVSIGSDLTNGKVVFSSKTTSLSGWIEQWYEKDGHYFFTVSNDSGLDQKVRFIRFSRISAILRPNRTNFQGSGYNEEETHADLIFHCLLCAFCTAASNKDA